MENKPITTVHVMLRITITTNTNVATFLLAEAILDDVPVIRESKILRIYWKYDFKCVW